MMSDNTNQNDVLNALQNQASHLQDAYSDERDIVNQILGQVQMANSIARFADVVSLTKLAHIKETRMYKALAGKKGVDPHGNEIADIGTFDGFCRALGLSRSKVDEDLTNLKHFGEEALNNLTAIGIGYREMRQYRKLPEDQKEALLEVAKTGDKTDFVELAEEIISKHTKEKDALTQQLDDTRADYEAQGEVLNKKSMELTEARFELEKTKRRIQTLKPDESIKSLRQEVSSIAYETEVGLMGGLRQAFDVLATQANEAGTDERLFMAGLIGQLEKQLIALKEDYSLPDAEGDELDWMNPEAVAAVEAEIGEQQFNWVDDDYEPVNSTPDDKEQSNESGND